jgi:hypothetical protein
MKLVFAFALLLFVSSCKQESGDSSKFEAIAALQSEVEQLNLENKLKDSMLNESLRFYSEIQVNLDNIDIRQDGIKRKTSNSEEIGENREWVVQEIQQINYLREENQKKVKKLQEQLNKSGIEVEELQNLIRKIMEDVQVKDEQIAVLREELDRSNKELGRLFDAYQTQEYELQLVKEEVNKAYYVYGSEKELSENGVISKKNGFIGIGKQIELESDMNMDYLTEVDLRDANKIKILGRKVRIITPHQASSFHLKEGNGQAEIIIDNPLAFWKVSKILIVVVK